MDQYTHHNYLGVAWVGSGLVDARAPDPAAIHADDIAHALAVNPRWNGHTDRNRDPYSIAAHSLFCQMVAEKRGLPVETRLACLLHDAPEYITGDIIFPIKRLCAGIEHLESAIWSAIAKRFNIPVDMPPEVKEIDGIAAEVERYFLIPHDAWTPAPNPPAEWHEYGKVWIDLFTVQKPHWTYAAALFSEKLSELLDQRTLEESD